MLKQMSKPKSVSENHAVKGGNAKIAAESLPPVATDSPFDGEMPAFVAADEKKAALWDDAGPDERFLTVELCKLDTKSNTSVIGVYLDFADAWHERFQKGKNRNYKRDMSFVKKGAAMSPYSESQVYKILRTVNVYTREKYARLAAEAAKHGVTIYWSALRVIAGTLGKSEFQAARKKVEQELVRTQLSEPKLRELIERVAPETAASSEPQDPQKESRNQLKTFLSTFRKTTNRFSDWQNALEQFELSEDPKQVAATRREVEEAIQLLDQMTQFINENRPVLEMLVDNAVTQPVPQVPDETVDIARRVMDKMNANKQAGASRDRTRGFSLSGEFATDDRRPKMDRRDDDDFSGLDGPGDEDEFDALYDNPPDLMDDDDLPDIFGENGEIPDFPPG